MHRPSPGSGNIRPGGSSGANKPFKTPSFNSPVQVPIGNRPVINLPPQQSQQKGMLPPSRVTREPTIPPPPVPVAPTAKRQEPPKESAPSTKFNNNRSDKTIEVQSNNQNVPPPPQIRKERSTGLSQPMGETNRRRMSVFNANIPPPVEIWRFGNQVSKSIFECGLALYHDKPGELYVEGSLFRREFAKKITQNELTTGDVIDFVEDFIADRGRLLRALMPTVLKNDDVITDNGGFAEQQQSFLRLLLGIEAIQSKLAEGLMVKLVDIVEPLNPDDRFHPATIGVDMPYVIVSQFKWLETIADPDKLLALFLEAITLDEKRTISKELISALPEVFSDNQHPKIVEKLRPLLTMYHSPYLADALDTFANLSLEPDVIEDLRDKVLKSLPQLAVDSLPAALKFILSLVSSENSLEVIGEIRENFVRVIDEEDFIATYSKEQAQSLFKLIFTEIKSALLLNSCQLTSWTKLYTQQLSALPEDALRINYEIREFDFVMLTILHSVSFKKKVIENVLKTRRRLGLISDNTIITSFKRYHEVLRDHLRSVVAIADSGVRTADTTISSFGRVVYMQAFCEFNNVCVRQDIVANLVTHVFSLPISSTNCAMDILLALSEEKPDLLVCFRVFVRNMLDVLDNLHLSDVRKLYRILANLAFAQSVTLSSVERTRFKDDLYMIIRKQLAFTGPENAKYRQFGVLAAAQLARGIGQWAKRSPDMVIPADEAAGTSSDAPRSEIANEIVDLFYLVQRAITSNDSLKSKDVASYGLFYDELSILVKYGSLPLDTINWLSEKLPNTFANEFFVNEKEQKNFCKIDQLQVTQNNYLLAPDGDEYNTIKIFQAAAGSILQPHRKGSDIYHLCPLFRLLAECSLGINGNVDILSGLLASPVQFPTLRSLQRVRKGKVTSLTEQYAICESLLALINWFRELISLFGGTKDPEIRGYCLRRLHDIIPATTELEEQFKDCPSWLPRYVESSVFNNTSGQKGRPQKSKKAAGKKDGAKKKKAKPTAAATQAKSQVVQTQSGAKSQVGGLTQGGATQALAQQSFATNFVVMARFRVAFRELSLESLQLIAGDLPNTNSSVSNSLLQMSASSANSSFTNIFTPQEALYLVEDLMEKLKYKLIKAGSKAFGSFAGSAQSGQISELVHRSLDEKTLEDVLVTAIDLVGPMCSLLHGCYQMLHEALEESGGTIDSLDSRPEWVSGLKLYSCIFDCFAMLLVNLPQLHPELVNKLLFSITNSQNKEIPRTPAKNADNCFEAFMFLRHFAGCLPTLLIAGSYLRTMEALLALAKRGTPNRSNMSNQIHDFCQALLENDWTEEECRQSSGVKVISNIFQAYLINSRDRLADSLRRFIDIATTELNAQGTGKEAKSTQFRTFSKLTFPAFYEVILSHMVRLAQTSPTVDNRADGPSQPQQQNAFEPPAAANFLSQRHHIIPDGVALGQREKLRAWEELGELFRDSVELVKPFRGKTTLISVIKHGRNFLEIFAKRAMPLLDVMFKSNPIEIREMLSLVQKGTRVLHIVCSESKSNKEVTIISMVPRLKKTLEAFVLRVKEMLSVNNCAASFFFGALKTRNLQGEEISSQNPYVAEVDVEEESRPKSKHPKQKKSKSATKESESHEEDEEGDGETIGDEDTEQQGSEDDEGSTADESEANESDNAESAENDNENETSDQYDDAADTLESSSSSSNARKRHLNSGHNKGGAKKRFSYSTAYEDDDEGDEDSASY